MPGEVDPPRSSARKGQHPGSNTQLPAQRSFQRIGTALVRARLRVDGIPAPAIDHRRETRAPVPAACSLAQPWLKRAEPADTQRPSTREKSAPGRSPYCLSGGVSVPVFTLGGWTRGRQLSGGQRCGSAAGASMTRPPLPRCMPRTRSGSSIRSASRNQATWPVCSRRRNRPSASSARRSLNGDQAAVPWSAQTRLKDGGTENLAGVSMLRFRADGLVAEERDFTQG